MTSPWSILVVLMMINIIFTAVLASVVIYNIYSTQASSYKDTLATRTVIIGKLNSITQSLADVLQNLTKVTIHLVNNTHAINATLHNLQGNQSQLENETGFQK
jgi:uncharacterized membrane protein